MNFIKNYEKINKVKHKEKIKFLFINKMFSILNKKNMIT